MMKSFLRKIEHYPIRKKLIAIGLINSFIAVLLTCALFVVYDYFSMRKNLIEQLELVSDITSSRLNFALKFDQKDIANTNLKDLEAKESIRAACVYNQNKTLFSSYQKDSSIPCSETLDLESSYFSWNHIILVNKIGQSYGWIKIYSDLRDIKEQFTAYIIAVLLISFLIIAISFRIGLRFQRFITEPIKDLTDTANEISRSNSYGTKATKYYNDEIGLLTNMFNTMLQKIHERDLQLNAINQTLEEKVKERTFKLEFAKAELEDALRVKDDFLANMNHEIRTPIHGVRNFLQFLVRDWGKLTDNMKEDLANKSYKASSRLNELINNLLDISKFEERRMEFEFINNNLLESVEQIIRETEITAANKKINISVVNTLGEPPMAIFDKARITQVTANLMVNAIKFSKEDTNIVITISKGSKQIANNREISGLQLAIKDEGVGIPPNQLEFIFERFAESDYTKTQAGGTGLGLSLSQLIIEAHGGVIWAENNKGKTGEPGKGATFFFILPTRD